MQYQLYEVSDFLEDDFFRSWVYGLNPAASDFWEDFMDRNPDKLETIRRAQTILRSIEQNVAYDVPSDEAVDSLWYRINSRTIEESSTIFKPKDFKLIYLSAAAVLVLVLSFGIWRYNQCCGITYQALVAAAPDELIEKENRGAELTDVILPDSSIVTLHPQSKISFSKKYSSNKLREVYLTGMAFFKVKKNPERPFYVYAGEIVTKVLGTSFLVKAFDADGEIEVNVRTGKVSVSARRDIEKDVVMEDPLVLLPNERMLFDRISGKGQLRKLLVEVPVIIEDEKISPPILKFQDAKVMDILASLQASYGVVIDYDKNILGSCLLTAEFTNETLFEKIDLICKGIEAEYQVLGTHVVISGRGCE